MLAALQHTLAEFLLETAGLTGVMCAAMDAVCSMTIAAKVAALNDPATGVDAVIVAATSGIVHRNATASYSLWPFPIIILNHRPSIVIDNYNSLRSSIDEHLLVVLNYNWIGIRAIILVGLLWS